MTIGLAMTVIGGVVVTFAIARRYEDASAEAVTARTIAKHTVGAKRVHARAALAHAQDRLAWWRVMFYTACVVTGAFGAWLAAHEIGNGS